LTPIQHPHEVVSENIGNSQNFQRSARNPVRQDATHQSKSQAKIVKISQDTKAIQQTAPGIKKYSPTINNAGSGLEWLITHQEVLDDLRQISLFVEKHCDI